MEQYRNKDWLYQKYIVDKMDANAIARLVNRDGKTIWSWLHKHKIPMRPRGSYFASNPAFTFWKTPGGRNPNFGRKFSPEFCERQRQIALADKRIPFDPKVGPPLKGKRGAEVPTWKGGVTPERQAFYSTPEWRVAVKVVWARDDATCQKCGRRNCGKERFAFDVHHIVSFEVKSLRANPTNLVLLCERCHYWVHSASNVNRKFIAEVSHAVV